MYKILVVFAAFLLFSCQSQKKYSDFDISYSRSGGYAPIYENVLIKGNTMTYAYEGDGKKSEKTFSLTDEEIKRLNEVLTVNNFRFIREDRKKVYDRISTTITVKDGPNSGSKSDASFIMPADQAKWDNIVKTFTDIISSKLNAAKE